MFSFRQIFRLGMQLTVPRKSVNLRQIPLIFNEKPNITVFERSFVHTKPNPNESSQESSQDEETNNKHVLGKLEGKLKLIFTCKCCNYRNGKIISKLAYEKGLIIVRCDGCKNNHLIADNLGWFEEMKNTKNIEKFLALKGESVRRIQNNVDGYIEVVAKAELDLLQHNKDQKHAIIEEHSEIQVKKKIGTSEET
ncbi:uncharacterized protein LOC143184202 [Calliopsis andreniformis]|uniref:uncharacterized protein LOC143184202 n=1 Tax=Calliopsis andreniformis TaxID=337506 RepID=UPI003FCDA59F